MTRSQQDVYCVKGVSLLCSEILPAVRELMPDMAYFEVPTGANDGPTDDDMKLLKQYTESAINDTRDRRSMMLVDKIISLAFVNLRIGAKRFHDQNFVELTKIVERRRMNPPIMFLLW